MKQCNKSHVTHLFHLSHSYLSIYCCRESMCHPSVSLQSFFSLSATACVSLASCWPRACINNTDTPNGRDKGKWRWEPESLNMCTSSCVRRPLKQGEGDPKDFGGNERREVLVGWLGGEGEEVVIISDSNIIWNNRLLERSSMDHSKSASLLRVSVSISW